MNQARLSYCPAGRAPGELSLIGSEADDLLLRSSCGVYVMEVANVDALHGASEYHRDKGAVNRYASRTTDRVVVVLDKSKEGGFNWSVSSNLLRSTR
jgi:DeoR/GlpR family transcriptional regulator of sugar metabolism